jgi:hypothetical protein
MLMPLVTTYRVEPPTFVGAKYHQATAATISSAAVTSAERSLNRFTMTAQLSPLSGEESARGERGNRAALSLHA